MSIKEGVHTVNLHKTCAFIGFDRGEGIIGNQHVHECSRFEEGALAYVSFTYDAYDHAPSKPGLVLKACEGSVFKKTVGFQKDMGTQGTFERIFWLDDTPFFFEELSEEARETGSSLPLEDLLGRCTFAFDLETGVKTVSEQEFDLYILDGDFPDELPPFQRTRVDEYLDALRNGRPFRVNPKDETMVRGKSNNFIRMRKHLKNKEKPVVVFSASDQGRDAASCYACWYNLPFYTKRDTALSTLLFAVNLHRESYQGLTTEGWEFGGKKELVDRYLVR